MQPLSHAFYIFASYGVSACVLGGVIAWVFFDARARKRELTRLEEQGLRRRSATEDSSKAK